MSNLKTKHSCRFVQSSQGGQCELAASNSLVRKRSRVRFPSWAPCFTQSSSIDTSKPGFCHSLRKTLKITESSPMREKSIRDEFVQNKKPAVAGLFRIRAQGMSSFLSPIVGVSSRKSNQSFVWETHKPRPPYTALPSGSFEGRAFELLLGNGWCLNPPISMQSRYQQAAGAAFNSSMEWGNNGAVESRT